jgi:hypothetical protein
VLRGHRVRPINDRAITGHRLLSPLLAITLLSRYLGRLVITARRVFLAVVRRRRLIRRGTPQPPRRPVTSLQHLQKTSRGSATQASSTTTTTTRTWNSSCREAGGGSVEVRSIIARGLTAAMASTRRCRTRNGPTSPSHGAGQAYDDWPQGVACRRARYVERVW